MSRWPRASARGVLGGTLGYDSELLVPEEDDISLKERCRRVNAWCLLHGKNNAICVSIHFNAHGNGYEWAKAIYTSSGNTAADGLATAIVEAAKINLPGEKLTFAKIFAHFIMKYQIFTRV